jgi:hypothetical protein
VWLDVLRTFVRRTHLRLFLILGLALLHVGLLCLLDRKLQNLQMRRGQAVHLLQEHQVRLGARGGES